jgi:hypothetical protein
MSKNNKKVRRVSPNSIRESPSITGGNEICVDGRLDSSTNSLAISTSTGYSKPEAVKALKSLLLSPSNTTPPRVPTDTAIKALKTLLRTTAESPSLSGKCSPLPSGTNSTTPPRSKKKSKSIPGHQSPYFAGSSFQNSPDPHAVPLPDFDETQSQFFVSAEPETTSPVEGSKDRKLTILHKALNITA